VIAIVGMAVALFTGLASPPFETWPRCVDGRSRPLYGFASSASKETTSGWGDQSERPADAPGPGDKPQRELDHTVERRDRGISRGEAKHR
jgi:hypothetical protein